MNTRTSEATPKLSSENPEQRAGQSSKGRRARAGVAQISSGGRYTHSVRLGAGVELVQNIAGATLLWLLPLALVATYLFTLITAALHASLLATPLDYDLRWLSPIIEGAVDLSDLAAVGEVMIGQASWVIPALAATMIALYAAGFTIARQGGESHWRLTYVGWMIAGVATVWAWGSAAVVLDNPSSPPLLDQLSSADPSRVGAVTAGLVTSFVIVVLAIELGALTGASLRVDSAYRRRARALTRLQSLADAKPGPSGSFLLAVIRIVAAALAVPVGVSLLQVGILALAGSEAPFAVQYYNVPFIAVWTWTSIVLAAEWRGWLRIMAWLFFLPQIVNLAFAAVRPIERSIRIGETAEGWALSIAISTTWILWAALTVAMCAPSVTSWLRARGAVTADGRVPMWAAVGRGLTLVTAMRQARYYLARDEFGSAQREVVRYRQLAESDDPPNAPDAIRVEAVLKASPQRVFDTILTMISNGHAPLDLGDPVAAMPAPRARDQDGVFRLTTLSRPNRIETEWFGVAGDLLTDDYELLESGDGTSVSRVMRIRLREPIGRVRWQLRSAALQRSAERDYRALRERLREA